MRLIDAYKVRCDRDDFDTYADYIKAFDAINEAPTVDAVPVIRCKDCKHTEIEEDGDIVCTFWDFCGCEHSVLEHGYCDRAERKEE